MKKKSYDGEVIKMLQERYDVGVRYIQMSIAGERNGSLSIKIQEEYKNAVRARKKTLSEIKDSLNK